MSGDVELVAELANVSKVFLDGWRREVRAVAGLTLCLRRGEIYGLLGPNGAGKSTALHCLLGLLRPSQGTAKLFGQSVEVGAPLFQRVGYMPEDWTAYDFLTVAEMLEVFADLHGVDRTRRRAQVRQALDRSGLTEHANRRLRRLSKGMRQRASLAQAILGEPDLLILDEPTKELDPLGRRDVRVLLGQLAQNGVTVLLSSHLLSEIETVCHRIGVMHRGSLVAEGELDSILAGSASRILRFALPPECSPPVGATVESGDVWRWRAATKDEVHRHLSHLALLGAEIVSVQPESVRLEDYFIEVITRP
jgi:ABC-2 type transport system ATP-binding protein